MTALLGWTLATIKSPVSISIGHQQFNYHWCPNLNLTEISESESEANSTHEANMYNLIVYCKFFKILLDKIPLGKTYVVVPTKNIKKQLLLILL